jgi:hypothetical protein
MRLPPSASSLSHIEKYITAAMDGCMVREVLLTQKRGRRQLVLIKEQRKRIEIDLHDVAISGATC